MNLQDPFIKYKNFVLSNNKLPKSINEISSDISGYVTVPQLESDLWKTYAETTLETCTQDPAFGEYTAREKMLAYFYTFLQIVKEDKEILELQLKNWRSIIRGKKYEEFKAEYTLFVKILIEEGQERGEIQKRPFISNVYPNLFWLAILSVLSFWLNDKSEDTEQTDVAVEKIVHLLFDTLAPNAVDSALDLVQFLIKQNFNGQPK